MRIRAYTLDLLVLYIAYCSHYLNVAMHYSLQLLEQLNVSFLSLHTFLAFVEIERDENTELSFHS